jgi:hypothetical protein
VSWRRRIRAGEAAVTAHGGSGARCSALTSASGGLVTTRGEGPCRHFKAHVAKIILVRAGLWGHLSNNHLPSPNSDSFFFSLPRNLSSALGSMSPTTSSQILARKRRRGVSLFTLFPFLGLLLINGKPPPPRFFGIYSRNGKVRLCFASFPQIIEKRRRDRINNSLSELRRLVPSAFEKQVNGESR